jgi:class 3 adenylate cyclase
MMKAYAASSMRPGPRPNSDIDERWRRARLANIRQELLAPINAITAYAEMIRDEVHRLALLAMLPDMDRMQTAVDTLRGLVERLLEIDLPGPGESAGGTMQERLRHDLRNPLSALKGYGEMLLEDVETTGCEALRADLEKLLTESARLLADLDVIVNFSAGAPEPAAGENDATSAMVANLLQTVRVLEPTEAWQQESGRILVVDDNVSNRELLIRQLSRHGHKPLEAESGRKALQILAVEEIDLVLLDLMMPDMNGLEVLAQLKADDRLHNIPVVMISGLKESDSVIRCIEAGAVDYLPKPFNPVLLRARINACLAGKRWHDRERRYLERLQAEKERSDALLRNILPGQIVGRLAESEVVIADRFEAVTILFCDLVGFTQVASRLTPTALVDYLNRLFSTFDVLTHRLGIEKIKTIGDSYMAAAGVPEARVDHLELMAELALSMLESVDRLNRASEVPFRVRIGMHSGPVVAGIIGTHKFIYDVWGDTVNVASRLEAHSLSGRIHVAEETCYALQRQYEFEPRGIIKIRGKGQMATAFLTGRRGRH